MTSELTALQLDALKEFGNIGAGNAATGLSKLLHKTVGISIPYSGLVDVEKIPRILGGEEMPVTAVYIHVSGTFSASLVLVFSLEQALQLAGLLLGKENRKLQTLDEESKSALRELGNICSSSYLLALSQFIKVKLTGSVPALASDMLQAVLDEILADFAAQAKKVLVLETEFEVEKIKIHGHFLFMPDLEGLKKILTALEV